MWHSFSSMLVVFFVSSSSLSLKLSNLLSSLQIRWLLSSHRKIDSRRSRRSGYVSSPSSSSNSSLENLKTPKSKAKEGGRKDSEAKLWSKSSSFSSKFPNSSRQSQSPPRMTGCLWCSPKKSWKKKSTSNKFADLGLDWGKGDDLMADFGPYSSKEQKKLMMKEEEKISREADKIVKWAKENSARIDISDIEDELSDDDSKPHFGHH